MIKQRHSTTIKKSNISKEQQSSSVEESNDSKKATPLIRSQSSFQDPPPVDNSDKSVKPKGKDAVAKDERRLNKILTRVIFGIILVRNES